MADQKSSGGSGNGGASQQGDGQEQGSGMQRSQGGSQGGSQGSSGAGAEGGASERSGQGGYGGTSAASGRDASQSAIEGMSSSDRDGMPEGAPEQSRTDRGNGGDEDVGSSATK